MHSQLLIKMFALSVWAHLPPKAQFFISRAHSYLYELRFSRWFITPYVLLNYIDGMSYLSEFGPSSEVSGYRSFQDFFTRKIVVPRVIDSDFVWPCDGLLCEAGRIGDADVVNIKGERRHLSAIFGEQFQLSDDDYFTNIFLHNSDYHRIHAPVCGEIKKVVHIPGELRFLRPWFYRQPSLPALTNERVNIEIAAKNAAGEIKSWLLSIVGGPGVATIELDSAMKVGNFVNIGQEMGLFRLGSTCCMVSPIPVADKIGAKVRMGDPLL